MGAGGRVRLWWRICSRYVGRDHLFRLWFSGRRGGMWIRERRGEMKNACLYEHTHTKIDSNFLLISENPTKNKRPKKILCYTSTIILSGNCINLISFLYQTRIWGRRGEAIKSMPSFVDLLYHYHHDHLPSHPQTDGTPKKKKNSLSNNPPTNRTPHPPLPLPTIPARLIAPAPIPPRRRRRYL